LALSAFGSVGLVSSLRSALEEYVSIDVCASSDEELLDELDELDELERATRVIELERARRLSEIERRGVYRRDGDLSMTSWLTRRSRIPVRDAARHVRLARALPRMRVATDALADGAICVPAAELLACARDADSTEFGLAEAMLVDLPRRLNVRAVRRAIERWISLIDAEANEAAAERRFERRALYVSPTLDGMVRVDGNLDAETGQTVITALRSLIDSWSRADADDARTPAQRRADALAEICSRYLDSTDRPVVAGERPHLTVTVDVEALERRAGRKCHLDEAGRITGEAARRLACDASVSRVIVGPTSEPLDVGRRTPVVPASLRRALVVRDGGCRFDACDRPAAWTDAHHIVHWADGGPTSLSNLVLLCRRHHRAVHEGKVAAPRAP
jgi:hypothetical protein